METEGEKPVKRMIRQGAWDLEIPERGYLLGVSTPRGSACALCQSEEEERELLGRLEATAGKASPCGEMISSMAKGKRGRKSGSLMGRCFAAQEWEGAREGWSAEGWIWVEGETLPDRAMEKARKALEERKALGEASGEAKPGRKRPGL